METAKRREKKEEKIKVMTSKWGAFLLSIKYLISSEIYKLKYIKTALCFFSYYLQFVMTVNGYNDYLLFRE